jgi:hypothetical protein
MAPSIFHVITCQVFLTMGYSVSSTIADQNGSSGAWSATLIATSWPKSSVAPQSGPSCGATKWQTEDDFWDCAGGGDSTIHDPAGIQRNLDQDMDFLLKAGRSKASMGTEDSTQQLSTMLCGRIDSPQLRLIVVSKAIQTH